MFRTVLQYFPLFGLEEVLDNTFPKFVEDYSKYVVVDGEEGDYGIITFKLPNSSEIFATCTNRGGDNDEYEFSETAKEMIWEVVETFIKNNKKEIMERF